MHNFCELLYFFDTDFVTSATFFGNGRLLIMYKDYSNCQVCSLSMLLVLVDSFLFYYSILDKTYSSETKFHTNVTGCEGTESEVRYLEHVQCKITLNFQPRGNLRLVLTSPQGTPSTLLSQRPRDEVSAALNDWPFLSVHFWGEDPRGIWALTVINDGAKKVSANGKLCYF